jgi:hypothetical protein
VTLQVVTKLCFVLSVQTYGLSAIPELCVVFSLMCVSVFHWLTYRKHHLSVPFCVCKLCAAFLDLCVGVLLLYVGSVTVVFVCSDRQTVSICVQVTAN